MEFELLNELLQVNVKIFNLFYNEWCEVRNNNNGCKTKTWREFILWKDLGLDVKYVVHPCWKLEFQSATLVKYACTDPKKYAFTKLKYGV